MLCPKLGIKLHQGVKAHYNGIFWKSLWQFFLSESSIVALYSNLFEKLSKSEIKN
jgi:hypothetical protein